MVDTNKSPAVQSLNEEKARQRNTDPDTLDQGLEATFPASDPVSATQTSVASAIDAEYAGERDEYPLVEEALQSTGELGGANHKGHVHSLRRDASRLSEQASEVASGAVAVGKAEAKSVIQSIEDIVRERPLSAVGIVAAVAWIWGATR
jgi:ElaB/YqjD/DUF883 family membrane-anchored ribosome-binding protein